MSKLIDLSHEFKEDMPVYPGDPCVKFYQIASFDNEVYTDHKLETGVHAGTHMDAPLHLIEGGKTIANLEIDNFKGKGCLVDVRGSSKIGIESIEGLTIEEGSVVLFFSGLSEKYYEQAYWEECPEFTEELAEKLVELKISMVGMDTSGPDKPPFPVHKILLGNEVLIIENLTNLEKLLNVPEFTVTAYPIKYNADAAPVRVVAEV